jgi:hypothetical protein
MLIEMLLMIALLKKSFGIHTIQVVTSTIDCMFARNLEGETMALFSTLLLVLYAAEEGYTDEKSF